MKLYFLGQVPVQTKPEETAWWQKKVFSQFLKQIALSDSSKKHNAFEYTCPATILPKPGKSYWRERLITVDLLVRTTLDQLLLIITLKQVALIRRWTVLGLPSSKCSLPKRTMTGGFFFPEYIFSRMKWNELAYQGLGTIGWLFWWHESNDRNIKLGCSDLFFLYWWSVSIEI